MDHLKTPSQVHHSIQVPYYGQFYDSLGLEGFAKRRHFDSDSFLSRPVADPDDRVSCKGAVAYFENMLECMHESVRQNYGQKIIYFIAFLVTIYNRMCQDAKHFRVRDASFATTFANELSRLRAKTNAAQSLRFKTWLASWFSTCRSGKAEEHYSIKDAIAYLVDCQIETYQKEEEPNVESCRQVFGRSQDYIKTMHKISMLTPDDLTYDVSFRHKILQSLENVSYRAITSGNSWYHTDIDKSMMIAYCLDGDFDALPGDRYYDGSDPHQYINWTTDFAVFDAKQRKDRDIVQSTRAALANNPHGVKHMKVSKSQTIEDSTEIHR